MRCSGDQPHPPTHPPSLLLTLTASLRLGVVVEQDGFDQAGQDLGHVNAHNLRDHLWEVDARLQGLSLDEQVIGELVQLPHNLRQRDRKENIRREMLNGETRLGGPRRAAERERGCR